jgi:hypothetical protein
MVQASGWHRKLHPAMEVVHDIALECGWQLGVCEGQHAERAASRSKRLTSSRRLDTSSVMRCPVAASSSSICAAEVSKSQQWRTKASADHTAWHFAAAATGACSRCLDKPCFSCSAALHATHLDLAVTLGQQPVADPVLWRKIAGAPPRGVLLAQHALRTVAPVVPAGQVMQFC